MSMSATAIDRVFEKLEAVYGSEWIAKWAKQKLSDVKTAWSETLAPFGSRAGLNSVAWALSPENLPERAPNAIEFLHLCRRAPAPAEPQLALPPKADPERLKAELAKLGDVATKARSSSFDHKAWARGLKAREEAGESLRPIQRRFWREALATELELGDA